MYETARHTNDLPQRTPSVGPLAPWSGLPIEVLADYLTALRKWAETPEASRSRSGCSSGPR